MKTTLELSEELARRIESEASRLGLSPRELVTAYLIRGLEAAAGPEEPRRERSTLPAFPDSGIRVPALTNAEINDLLDREDLTRWGHRPFAEPGRDAAVENDAR